MKYFLYDYLKLKAYLIQNNLLKYKFPQVLGKMVDDKEMILLDQQLTEKKWIPGPDSERLFTNHFKSLNKILD